MAGVAGRSAPAQSTDELADPTRLEAIDGLVSEAIDAGLTPGAVVLVGQHDRILYEKAFGRKTTGPDAEPLTTDTIFDLASLTKVVGTTTAVMQLVEQGRIRLSEPVARLLPGFGRYGKDAITVRHLLTHTSGLRPDVDLGDGWTGHDAAMALAIDEVPTAGPGERFVYSDINFFVLGDLVARVSGLPLDRYLRERVFGPLGMRDTGFRPAAPLRGRIAPTERCLEMDAWPCNHPGAPPLLGVVHDPTARRMGGVAGHAGLFSTARDLSRFARMLLGGGTLDGARVLSPVTVARMTSPATPAGLPAVRGLGWDIDSPFSSNRGDLFGRGSFGHTGFTGTSIWVDPASGMYVVFLSSRLYPDGKGDVTALRGKVATVAASALAVRPADAPPASRADFGAAPDPLRPAPRPSTEPVLAGVDVLARDGFRVLAGKRVGLLTNHTGVTASGQSTIDLLASAPEVRLVSLFSPEHGIRGEVDADVPSGRDERTGLPVHSLYGETRRPTAGMLAGLDAVVIDLQSAGARFYTYTTTVAYVLEAAAAAGIEVVVLDRPDPIGGWQIEGPAAERAGPEEFIAYLPGMPVRHGLTLGEFARLVNAERGIGARLSVVPMEHWRRDAWFDETGLTWIGPSPNLRTLTQAALYPGVATIEYANVSVGRGTDRPFEVVGAPWMDGRRVAAALNARGLPGVRFYPVRFRPDASRYAGEWCGGVSLIVTDRNALRPVRMGLELAAALWQVHGDTFDAATTARLLGSQADLDRVRAGEDPARVADGWAGAEARWRRVRAPYLLYR
ncbi:MAG: serine hydrolase [Vicinamibacterales bacterium]